jgi:hypothetical protein
MFKSGPMVRLPSSPMPPCILASAHAPERSPRSKLEIRHGRDNIMSSASSALVPGMLQTGILRCPAAPRSILLMSTPIFWISFSFGAAPIIPAVQRGRTCQKTSQPGNSRNTFPRHRPRKPTRSVSADLPSGWRGRGRRRHGRQCLSPGTAQHGSSAKSCLAAERFLNPEHFVPFGHAFAPGEAAHLELAGAPADSEVRDRHVLGFA